ncbi:cupin domain-containing protein [Actinomycetospora chiangmaiensis]|uniref:cupin domain-containing protein n=1 Tax=Actinomycetospora chiangmaiensis TaxID=402650 RepID=UPI00037BFE79|nr:cupin domain-containing protein [Actinomycetospora chiangmaiensis]
MSLLTAAVDQPWETWDDPVRGHLRWCLLDGGLDPAPHAVTTGVLDLAPGDWLGRHRHAATELYFVVSGSPVVWLDGRETVVAAGTHVRLPGGIEHGLRAVDDPVRVLFSFPTTAFADVVHRFRDDPTA